jgi:ecotin
MKAILQSLLLAALATTLHAGEPTEEAQKNLKAFPAPEQGMTRHVIYLPKEPDESLLKVELVLGKTVVIDEQNRYFFGGKIEEDSIQGWGFTRYVLPKLGPMAGTLMAVPPDAPKIERFITLGGEPKLLRYNSRLPLVVYVPEDVEVLYRIWRAEPVQKAADEA